VICDSTSGVNTSVVELDPAIKAKNYDKVGIYCQKIYERVEKAAATDKFLLILGGDHSIPMGTLPAILKKRPKTGVVWVDAHADINTTKTTGSGNMHGMTVAFLLGLEKHATATPYFNWFPKEPLLKPEDVVYIGLRDLDKGEKVILRELGIRCYTMSDIDRLGIGKVMEETTDYFSDRDMDIHLSYDIDAIDPVFAPHTGTCVIGGLTFREGNYVCEALAATGRLTSMELVEVNPMIHFPDSDNTKTLDMALTLVGSALGRTII